MVSHLLASESIVNEFKIHAKNDKVIEIMICRSWSQNDTCVSVSIKEAAYARFDDSMSYGYLELELNAWVGAKNNKTQKITKSSD